MRKKRLSAERRQRSFERAAAVVNYIERKYAEKDPGSGWENLPWLIQYYILKYFRHIGKVTALNPGMEGMGGLIGASKIGILKRLSSSSYPKTVLVKKGTADEQLKLTISRQFPDFPAQPVVCKPDIGERSVKVKVVRDYGEAFTYSSTAHEDFLIQEYVPGPMEYAVSCIRNLETQRLEVAAVVSRNIVKDRGDGQSSVGQLIDRAAISAQYKERIRGSYTEAQLRDIPPAGETVLLSPAASLAYGTVIEEIRSTDYPEGFKRLEEYVNGVCIDDSGKPFSGFNYGRFDFRAPSLEDLFSGRGMILELNGAAAMALHACVPGLPTWRRYEIYTDFFDRMCRICEANRREGRGTYTPLPVLYCKVRRRLRRSSVQRKEVSRALREIRAARRELRRGGRRRTEYDLAESERGD